MPNIKSAKKRVKVTETKTLQNKMFRSQMKTDIKKYQAAPERQPYRRRPEQPGTS